DGRRGGRSGGPGSVRPGARGVLTPPGSPLAAGGGLARRPRLVTGSAVVPATGAVAGPRCAPLRVRGGTRWGGAVVDNLCVPGDLVLVVPEPAGGHGHHHVPVLRSAVQLAGDVAAAGAVA